MSSALAIRDAAPVVTPDQQTLILRTVAAGATADELKLYLYDCARQGVHPLDGLIHFVKRSGKYKPVTSIDFLRIRAAETGEYAGNDDPRFTYGGDGPETPAAASVTVYRLVDGEARPFSATARWREYFPGDQGGHMWRKMPHTMLGKCAEALALRKGFPRQLAGLYTNEELDQAGDDPIPDPAPPPPTPEEPAPGPVVIPEGAVTITKVDLPWAGQKGNAKAFVFHSAMPAGTSAGIPVYSSTLKAVAEDCAAARTLVRLEIVKSSTDRVYLKSITKVETAAGMVTAAEIPFSS